MALSIGNPAPSFQADSTSGKKISLKDYKGKWLVLYFYPRAFTPGCTKESCALRDSFQDIKILGAQILGISLDKIETQIKFKQKYNLPFELLSDNDKNISKSYETLGFFGLYAKRKTFIINPKGTIAQIFDQVSVARHDEQVLKFLEQQKRSA